MRISLQPLPLAVCISILILAASLRFSSLNWGSDSHRKAEEENFLLVQSLLELPQGLAEYFDYRNSPANPFLNERDFAFPVYGSFPALAAKLFTRATPGADRDALRFRARKLAVLADLIVLLLIGVAGTRAVSPAMGILAMTFYALFPLPIAHAHSATSGWAALIPNVLLFGIIFPGARSRASPFPVLNFVGFGALFGLAVACDPRNALLVVALPYVIPLRGSGDHAGRISIILFYSFMALASAWVTFRILQLYAFQENSIIRFQPDFLSAAQKILLGEASAHSVLGFFAGDAAVRLNKVIEFGFWGFGPLAFCMLPIIILGGVAPKTLLGGGLRAIALGTVVLFYVIWPLFQTDPDPISLVFACPAAALLLAEFLVELSETAKRRVVPWLLGLLLASGGLSACFTASLFTQANPYERASRWIGEHLEPGATILVERGAPRLPGPVDGKIPGPYRFSEYSVHDPQFDTRDRFFQTLVNRSDALVLSSAQSMEPGRLANQKGSEFLTELLSGRSRFAPSATFSCGSGLIRWQHYRRWIPVEVRTDVCPPVVIFLPKRDSLPPK